MRLLKTLNSMRTSAEIRRLVFGRFRLHARCMLQARLSQRSGVRQVKRTQPLVINLTTIPSRLNHVHLAIASLLAQTEPADQIVLWVSSDCAKQLPQHVLRLKKRGLEIAICEDVGPHTKLIHALNRFPDSLLVTADDDVIYPPQWLAQLYAGYQANRDCIICHRAHHMLWNEQNQLLPYDDWHFEAIGKIGPSHALFLTGVGGVLYFPKALHQDATDQALIARLAPTNDDIWFKAMALLNDTKVCKVSAESGLWVNKHTIRNSEQKNALKMTNIVHGQNDVQLANVIEHYQLQTVYDQQPVKV